MIIICVCNLSLSIYIYIYMYVTYACAYVYIYTHIHTYQGLVPKHSDHMACTYRRRGSRDFSLQFNIEFAVGSHNVDSRNFNLRVSNPRSKYIELCDKRNDCRDVYGQFSWYRCAKPQVEGLESQKCWTYIVNIEFNQKAIEHRADNILWWTTSIQLWSWNRSKLAKTETKYGEIRTCKLITRGPRRGRP